MTEARIMSPAARGRLFASQSFDRLSDAELLDFMFEKLWGGSSILDELLGEPPVVLYYGTWLSRQDPRDFRGGEFSPMKQESRRTQEKIRGDSDEIPTYNIDVGRILPMKGTPDDE